MKTFILLIGSLAAVAHGFSGGDHHSNGNHHSRSSPRYYNDVPPHLLPSSRPSKSLHLLNDGSSYKTMNPAHMQSHRNERSDQSAQLIASASNTPVLVLKKDHSRPILSSAIAASTAAAAAAEKRTQQISATQQLSHDNGHGKPIPTVIMERPGAVVLPPPPQISQQLQSSSSPQQQQEEKKQHEEEDKRSPPAQQQQKEKESRHEMSLERDVLSEEDAHSNSAQLASAERRMFFETMSQNNAIAQQVSGPQGPSSPRKPPHHHANHHLSPQQQQQQLQQQQQRQQQRLSHSASSLHNTRAHALSGPQHRPPIHHAHLHDDEEEEPVERIVRSNSPYSSGGDFQYPPPQGNYIAQGPTRVPVKFQQGVIALKPQGHAPGGQQQQQRGPGGRPRPYKQRIQQQQGGGSASEEPLNSEELEDEEEEAQPDRLQELLATSKFGCDGKKDGYYADDGLQCEVFHYCNAGAKHSWLCPNGFAFHQIHLICVPPSSDNICKQSSNYHFVNEYLYKPINEKEAEAHNTTLKYADRYFPDGYNHGSGDVLLPYNNDDEEEDRPVRHQQPQQHHQSPAYNPYANVHQPRVRPQQPQPQQQPQHHQFNPYAQQPQQQQRPQQFSSPSSGGFVPSQQHRIPQQQQQQQRLHPSQYAQQRSSGSSPQSQQILPQKPVSKSKPSLMPNGNVFFTPDSINIPLQQRRPLPHNPSHHPQMTSFRPSPQVGMSSKAHQQKQQQDDEYEY